MAAQNSDAEVARIREQFQHHPGLMKREVFEALPPAARARSPLELGCSFCKSTAKDSYATIRTDDPDTHKFECLDCAVQNFLEAKRARAQAS
eukprot:NODE_2657_length_1068_cov_14.965653_g2214_i0.p3 GENE.NODE_2657_length_1068_cov_14.965653_g2214_i0~~NODE_2657_length_1068_cov_14.965653_g2214_i0.p3  ORF type:complete len:92 (+),score=22.80 NODE_2657_length_1068_cov_14.965653_g2214_i0:218-493(+)